VIIAVGALGAWGAWKREGTDPDTNGTRIIQKLAINQVVAQEMTNRHAIYYMVPSLTLSVS
jgi:hypothetical protein